MVIEVDEVDNSLTQIVWTFQLDPAGGKHEDKFKTDQFLSHNPQMHISCSYSPCGEVTVNSNHKYKLCLTLSHLRQWPRGEDKLQRLSEGGGDRIKQREPVAIIASVNGVDEKFILHETYMFVGSANWSTMMAKEIHVSALNCNPCKPLIVTCRLWIKFNTLSPGEEKALEILENFCFEEENCDVQFCFDGDNRVGGHIFILAARSPVFAAMFQHNLQETKTGQVVIKDIEKDTFTQLLNYIYSGETETPLTELGVDAVQSLFLAADKYDIGDLNEECVHYLISSVNVNNAIKLMVFAHLHSIDELMEAALDFVARNHVEIFQLDDWATLVKKLY